LGELDFDLFMLSTATAAVVAGRLGLDPKHVLAPSTYQRDETEELVEQANVAPISHAWHRSECEACAWHGFVFSTTATSSKYLAAAQRLASSLRRQSAVPCTCVAAQFEPSALLDEALRLELFDLRSVPMAVRFCEGGIGGRPGRHFGWRLSGYLKVLLWVRLFSFGLSVFAVDADWMAVAPLPASDLLRCDVTAFPDHVKLFNIGLMVLRNTGPTSRAVLRIANRTYAAWDQAVVNEEVAASAATCCVTNWSALFARSQETHHAKSHEALVGAPAACTNDTPFALGPPVNFSRGLHGGLFRDWNHVKYNHLTMHQRRTNRCWHNATSSLDQGDKEAKARRHVMQAWRRAWRPGDALPNPKDESCTASTHGVRLPWAAQSGLPPLPVRWNDSNAALPSYQRARPKKCAILIDRHVHKNGGSTVRDILLEQERLGYALYQGFTQLNWGNVFQKLQKLVTQALAAGSTPRMVMLLEAHFGMNGPEMNGPVLEDLDALRGQLKGHDCPIFTTTRVREPLDFYLSFYLWGVYYRQKDPASFGASFEEWARMVPNLQSTILLHSMSAGDAEYTPRSYKRKYGLPYVPPQQLLRQTQQFLRRFDLVATMERFDEHLLMASDAVGLPFMLYRRNMPKKKGGCTKTKGDICPDMDKCHALIKEVAPVDHEIYGEFHPAFEERVAALGPTFATRVAEYKAELQRARAVWTHALRPQYLCRYRPEWRPLHPEWKLREANLRCPLEGPGALELCQAAYTYRAVECPWQYRPNTSDTDPLGCWRPSTGFK